MTTKHTISVSDEKVRNLAEDINNRLKYLYERNNVEDIHPGTYYLELLVRKHLGLFLNMMEEADLEQYFSTTRKVYKLTDFSYSLDCKFSKYSSRVFGEEPLDTRFYLEEEGLKIPTHDPGVYLDIKLKSVDQGIVIYSRSKYLKEAR